MSNSFSNQSVLADSTKIPALNAVVAEVQSYMRCSDLLLLKNAADENFLIKLLLLGISGGREEDIKDPALFFDELHSQGNRQVCQYQFKRNDIVWTCRDCQADETCVLCNVCFQGSDHTGHDVYFYHSQVGGCCDCGDVNAWSPEGFCSKHGKAIADPLEHVAPDIKTVGTQILGVLSDEMALFCEERKACFDFDSIDFFDRFAESHTLKREGEKEKGGGEPAAHPIAAPFFSLTTAAALLDISHSDGDGADVGLNSEDFSDSHDEDSATAAGTSDSEGDVLCLHNDDISTSDKIIVDLLSIGVSVEEASRIRAETVTIGSSNFLPIMNRSLLPQSIVSAGNRMTIRLTERVKRRLTPAMTRFLLLQRAAGALKDMGLKVGIMSQSMLNREDRARIALSWLTDFSQINDGMCRMVSLSLSVGILLRILKVFHHLPKAISGPLHNLFLSQMADKMFKKNLAIAYAEGYVHFTKTYGLGHGTTENSIFSLSVQFLNRDFLVLEIVDFHNFFVNACKSIENMLATACEGHGTASDEAPYRSQENPKSTTRLLDHPVLTHRRYNPMFADLKVIFAIPGMSRRFLASTMPIFMRILDRFQYMHPQCRETQQHVMYDSVEWMTAFNLYLCIGNLFDWLNNWLDDPSSTTHSLLPEGNDGSLTAMQPDGNAAAHIYSSGSFCKSCNVMDAADSGQNISAASGTVSGTSVKQGLHELGTWEENSLPSMTAVLHSALNGVLAWQARHVSREDMLSDPQQRIDQRITSLVPTLCLPTLPAAFSFHLPLHRFLSSIISEACKYPAHTDALLAIQRNFLRLIADADSALDDTPHSGSSSSSSSSSSSNSNDLVGSREIIVRKLGSSHQLAALIDYPIRSSLLGAQIRAGLWRKNGAAVRDQLPNYMEVPYCKVLKDLDVLLIQFCGSNYGANKLVCHVFERYGVRGYLAHWCDADSRRSSGDGERERERAQQGLTDDSTDSMGEEDIRDVHPFLSDSPPSTHDCVPDDIAFLPALADEALLLLINIITEIPPPPSSDTVSQAIVSVKRELIHFLAGKKSNHSTFSQMHEHVSYCGLEFTKIGPVVLEQVVNEIADKKKSSALEPPFFVLKKEMWKHYDPSAPHVTRRMHQNAAEDRPKNSTPTPFCPPPQMSHTAFSSLRVQMVFEPLLLHSLRNLVLCATAARTPHSSYAAVRSWDLDCGGVLLNRALHLLTIALHLVDQDQATVLKKSSAGKSNDERVSSLLDTSSGPPADVTSTLATFLLQEPGSRVTYTTRDSTSSAALPHFLCALSDLEEVLDPTHEHVQKSALSWILLRCENLNPYCKSYSQSRRLDKGESREVSMEEKKRKARERAMKAMKASASKFTAHITDEENTNKKEKGNDVLADPEWESGNINGRKEDIEQVGDGVRLHDIGGDASLTAMGFDDKGAILDEKINKTVCIVCQAEEEEPCQGKGVCRQAPKIGLLAFSQCSHATMRESPSRPPAIRLALDFESCNGDDGEIHLSFCGHAMHYSCFDSYYASMLGRDKSHTDMMLDTDRGHFDCPLCKRLSNLLVPVPSPVPVPAFLSRTENASQGVVVGEGLIRTGEEERRDVLTALEFPSNIERKRKTEGIVDVPESSSSKKSHRPQTILAASKWREDSAPHSPHDREAVHQSAGRKDSLLLSVAGEATGSSSSCGKSDVDRCTPALDSSSSSSSSNSVEQTLPEWVTWIRQPHLVARARSRTANPDEKYENISKSNFHRHRRSVPASKVTENIKKQEGVQGEADNEVMGREGYDSTYSGAHHRYEESHGTNDDEVCVMGEESGQSGEDAEGDDVWCDVCDLSALDVHRGEDVEDGDIEDEIPPDHMEDYTGQGEWSWEGAGEAGNAFYDNHGTADGIIDDDVEMNVNDFYGLENHEFFRSTIPSDIGFTSGLRHWDRLKILTIFICHLTRQMRNKGHKSTIEFWSRFLIGFCEPKLGATDSLEWHNNFEDNRRKILKSAASLCEVSNFDDAAVKRDGGDIVERLLVHLYFGPAQVKHLETVLSGIAFSFSMDEVESSHVGIEKGFPRMRLLDAAINGVGSSLRCFRGYSMVLRSLQTSLQGKEESHNREDIDIYQRAMEEISRSHREEQKEKMGMTVEPSGKMDEADRAGATTACDSSSWLDKPHLPLLARPLLDCIVLLMALAHPSVIAETEQERLLSETEQNSMAASASSGYSFERQEALRKEMIREVLMSREEGGAEAVSDTSAFQRGTSLIDDVPCATASAVRWLCLAHLMQCIITHSSQHDLSKACENVNSTHFSTATTNDLQLNNWAVAGIFREVMKVVLRFRPSFGSRIQFPFFVDEIFMRGVLESWNSFLLVVAHMLQICRPDLTAILCPQVMEPKAQTKYPHPSVEEEDISSSSRLSDGSLSAAMEAVGLQSLLRDVTDEINGTARTALWVEITAAAARWVRALDNDTSETQAVVDPLKPGAFDLFFSRINSKSAAAATSADRGDADLGVESTQAITNHLPHLKRAVQRTYPFLSKPRLFPLPSSYTQLHSQLTAMGGYSFPALCLICGAVMDANGRGKCAAHSKICNKDAGIVFLLQDCTVLLSIGPRCAYFPTPYVDDYGEMQRHCRGKPLHLDLKRLEILRKLWASHGVGNEVYQKRSTSSRVVINGHY